MAKIDKQFIGIVNLHGISVIDIEKVPKYGISEDGDIMKYRPLLLATLPEIKGVQIWPPNPLAK